MSTFAMFAELVSDETGRPAQVGWVGREACYVLDDAGFERYVDAESVDRQVLRFFKQQVDEHRDMAVRGMLQMLGKDDIFSKTALEYQLEHMEEQGQAVLPAQAREMLRSLGFGIIIDFHGELVRVEMPEEPPPGWGFGQA